MSFNIRHGLGLDGRLNLDRAAVLINSESPDLCALQEIDDKCHRSGRLAQTAFLSEHCSLQGVFGKFMDFDGGEYGMASLSSVPVLSSTVLNLPRAILEPRSTIVQTVNLLENDPILFANVHFDWLEGTEGDINRLLQAKTLVEYIDSLGLATVIAGDFNCGPSSNVMAYLQEQGFVFVEKGLDNLSFQGKTKAEIDHLVYRNSRKIKFNIESVTLLEEPTVSDHRPLVVVLNYQNVP